MSGKKHCANCAHWGVKGSEESMSAFANTHVARWGHAPEEDERWRWCARTWDGRADVMQKNGSTMAMTSADYLCEYHSHDLIPSFREVHGILREDAP